jgi:hypothetical protein
MESARRNRRCAFAFVCGAAGAITRTGPARELLADDSIRAAYLSGA